MRITLEMPDEMVDVFAKLMNLFTTIKIVNTEKEEGKCILH